MCQLPVAVARLLVRWAAFPRRSYLNLWYHDLDETNSETGWW
jgi:hypothetical protein